MEALTSVRPILDFPGTIMAPLTSIGPLHEFSWASNGTADVGTAHYWNFLGPVNVSGPITGTFLGQYWDR